MPPAVNTPKERTLDERHDVTFRKVRGILNKLAPEKFDKLSLELLNVGISSHLVLKGIILLIFEKALDEPKYSPLYAQLCHRLDEDAPNFDPPDSDTTAVTLTTFRRLLLNKCRDEFENRARARDAFDKDDLTPDEAEQQLLAKFKMLGNIKFICELGKLDMLHEGILHKCIKQLLEKKKHTELRDMGEDIECLCQIMKTVGVRLDTDKAKAWMDQYFQRMAMFMDCQELPSRIRFALQDVIELRNARWRLRKNKQENGPRTITQVRQEAAKDMGVYYPAPGEPASMRGPQHVMSLFEKQIMMNGGGGMGPRGMPGPAGRAGGMADMFSNTMPGFMGSCDIGTGPGVIHMDAYGGYSTNMGRNRGMPTPGFQPQPFGRQATNGVGNKPRYDNQQQNDGGGRGRGTQNNYRQQQQQREGQSAGRELPPRFRKQQQSQENGVGPTMASVPYPPPRPDESVPLNYMSNGMKGVSNGNASKEMISLRPAKNFTVLKPAGPAQGQAQPTPLTKTFIPPEPVVKSKDNSEGKNNKHNKKSQLSLADLKTAVEGLVADYLKNTHTNTAINTLRDARAPKKLMPEAISHMIMQTLDKTDEDRDNISKLVVELKEESMITSEHFIEAFSSLLTRTADLETDTPGVRSYVAQFGAQAVVTGLVTLADISEPMQAGQHYPLFLLILNKINSLSSEQKLTEMFNSSKINLQDMLPECDRNKERMIEILEERGLSFMFPLLRIQADLWKQICADSNPNTLFKWIKDNLDENLQTDPGFIQGMMSSILRYVTGETTLSASALEKAEADNGLPEKITQEKETELLGKYMSIMSSFLHERPALQLTAIYSLQMHCHNSSWPKGMLLRMFVALYDLEIIEEESFIKWKEEVNDEYPGKGKALFQVNQWLTWLEQAEEESEEED